STVYAISRAPITGGIQNDPLNPTNPADPNYLAQIDLDGAAPTVSVDQNNPNKLVAVWTAHHRTGNIAFEVFGAYSADAGVTWFQLPLQANLGLDPNPEDNNGNAYNRSKDATVAFDRKDNVYVAYRELTTAET